MRLEDLNWMDVESYLQRDDRLMLVTGAAEQHGYLSLLTDIKIPLALADAASQKTDALAAPPLNFGCSPYFLACPGAFSLRASTLMDVAEDLARPDRVSPYPGAERSRRQCPGPRPAARGCQRLTGIRLGMFCSC